MWPSLRVSLQNAPGEFDRRLGRRLGPVGTAGLDLDAGRPVELLMIGLDIFSLL
jgi:hypothetical protein